MIVLCCIGVFVVGYVLDRRKKEKTQEGEKLGTWDQGEEGADFYKTMPLPDDVPNMPDPNLTYWGPLETAALQFPVPPAGEQNLPVFEIGTKVRFQKTQDAIWSIGVTILSYGKKSMSC